MLFKRFLNLPLQAVASRVFIWQRVNQLVYLLRNILLAWYITPSEFGDFATALNLASYVAILSAFEFRTAFFAAPKLSEEQIRVQWSSEVLLNAFTVLVGLALTPWFEQTRSWSVITPLLCLLVVNLLEASFSTQQYLLEKDLRFPFLTAMTALVNLGSFAVTLFLAMRGWGWTALVIDRIAAAGIKAAVLRWKVGWSPHFLLRWTELRYYGGFAGKLFLTGLLGKVIFGFDIYAVGKWIGAEANGIYSMAMKWALIPMELGGGFLAIMALSLYSRQKHEGPEAFRTSYTEVTFHITRFCLAIAVLMAIFMKDFFALFYHNNWQTVPLVFCALLPYAILRPLYQNVSQALQAQKMLWPIFNVMLAQSIVAVVLIWGVLPGGLLAVALATACSLGAGYIALELYLYRSVRHPLAFLFSAPTLLAVLAIAAWIGLARGAGPTQMGLRIGIVIVYSSAAFWEWRKGIENKELRMKN